MKKQPGLGREGAGDDNMDWHGRESEGWWAGLRAATWSDWVRMKLDLRQRVAMGPRTPAVRPLYLRPIDRGSG